MAGAKVLELPKEATSAAITVTAESLDLSGYDEFVKVVVPENGFYRIKIARDNGLSWQSYKILKKDLNSYSSYESYDDNSAGITEYLEAGEYYVELEFDNDKDKPFYVSLEKPVKELAEDKAYNIKGQKLDSWKNYFKFVPTEDGRYVFATSDSKNLYSYINVYDENYNSIMEMGWDIQRKGMKNGLNPLNSKQEKHIISDLNVRVIMMIAV